MINCNEAVGSLHDEYTLVLGEVSLYARQLVGLLNNDGALATQLGSNNAVKLSERKFLATVQKWRLAKQTDMFAIVLNGDAIGVISLSHQNLIARTAQIGYWIGSAYWGKGYASEAFELVLAQAKRKGIQCVTSTIRNDNTASKRIWDKYGATVNAGINLTPSPVEN